ncbi:MAG: AMP-binding protein [Hyphomicrobiaceae bacterium]
MASAADRRADLLHPEIETIGAAELARLQEAKWARQWDHVRAASAFYRGPYREKFGRDLPAAVTLDGLEALALTEKDEIKAGQERAYPLGEHVAADPAQIVRFHRTSGTTGRAMVIAYSAKDAAIVARIGGRGYYTAGLRPGDRVVHCLNYCLWTGGVTDHMALEAAGATVVPFGVGHTEQLLQIIIELGVNALSSTPSYPALMEKVLRETMGREPRSLGLRLGLFGGEAGLDNEGFRDRLEATWGFKVRNANFGLSEVMSILGSQCEATNDLHFIAGDAVFAEILDPASGRRLPIREGTTGELVCTNLEKECQPLVRYRARDVITVTGPDTCRCGRTSWRFRVTGRTDDMFNVRGVNVFPTALQRIVAGMGDIVSGHFRIVLEGPGPYDRVKLKVEAAKGVAEADRPAIARAIEDAVRRGIGASAEVTMIAFEALPRTAGKTSLIERI